MATNLLGFIHCYFRLPETKGRSYGELDILFAAGVPARKFKSTHVEEFDEVLVQMDEKEKEDGTEVHHVEVR